MKIKLKNFSIILVVLFLTSCTTSNLVTNEKSIQKRKYNNGFFVNLLKKKQKSHNLRSKTFYVENSSKEQESKENFKLMASGGDYENLQVTNNPYEKIDLSGFTTNYGKQVNPSDNSKSAVKNQTGNNFNLPVINNNNANHSIFSSLKSENNEATESGSEGKSQLVALLLAIFIGAMGIHRFYLGYTTIGIIQLLTLGACGIWTLIDIIMIITGDLKPNGGSYSEKL